MSYKTFTITCINRLNYTKRCVFVIDHNHETDEIARIALTDACRVWQLTHEGRVAARMFNGNIPMDWWLRHPAARFTLGIGSIIPVADFRQDYAEGPWYRQATSVMTELRWWRLFDKQRAKLKQSIFLLWRERARSPEPEHTIRLTFHVNGEYLHFDITQTITAIPTVLNNYLLDRLTPLVRAGELTGREPANIAAFFVDAGQVWLNLPKVLRYLKPQWLETVGAPEDKVFENGIMRFVPGVIWIEEVADAA